MVVKTSQAGIDALKEMEALSLKAYREPNGTYSIGYGHNGPDVTKDLTITEAVAEQLLREDLGEAEQVVNQKVQVDLTQGQFDALVLFTYNVGVGAFQQSTLLRKLNLGDPEGAANEFNKWTKSGGQVLKALVARRAKEKRLFMA